MRAWSAAEVRELVRERGRTAALLSSIEQRLAEIERSHDERLFEIAEAEEAGDWPRAGRLRSSQLLRRPRFAGRSV